MSLVETLQNYKMSIKELKEMLSVFDDEKEIDIQDLVELFLINKNQTKRHNMS